jgi:hypothetical protein
MPLPGPPAEKDPPPPMSMLSTQKAMRSGYHNYQGIIGTVPGIHALARTAGGERPAAPHEHVEHAEGDEIRVS